MTYNYTKKGVFNRGLPPDDFLTALVTWGTSAPDDIFSPRPAPPGGLPDPDIYAHVKPELGPWEGLEHRRAVMLEVMRVLAGFESSWDFAEGVDTTRLGPNSPENSEAGAWQVSYDSRYLAPELATLLKTNKVTNGVEFQRVMKVDHRLAMEYVSRLMRNTWKHHGPLYKGEERLAIRRSLRDPKYSVYPWLSRSAVTEFQELFLWKPSVQ